ncbi:hypothetical protein FXO37_33447 [Capsicum annuum]|nr:hypothetical protein FXO37_33447 [Capsicum annuum]
MSTLESSPQLFPHELSSGNPRFLYHFHKQNPVILIRNLIGASGTSQMATLIFEDMIGGDHLKAQDLVTLRAQKYAKKTHLEHKQGRVWKIAWSIEDLRTHDFGQHLMGHDLVIFIKVCYTRRQYCAGHVTTVYFHEDLGIWYEGLSEKFLSSPVPKILLLAGTDRLDRALTIGQMQGKFQMVVVRHTGHAIQEDVPDEFVTLILNFISHNRIGQHGIEIPDPMYPTDDSKPRYYLLELTPHLFALNGDTEILRKANLAQCGMKGECMKKKLQDPWHGFQPFLRRIVCSLTSLLRRWWEPFCNLIRLPSIRLGQAVYMDIENELTGESRNEAVHIRYDYLPKYWVKCKLHGRDMVELELSDDLFSLANELIGSWIIGGEFNIVLSEEEKYEIFSSSSPDDITGRFYQVCWDIVSPDVIRMLKDFLGGSAVHWLSCCEVIMPLQRSNGHRNSAGPSILPEENVKRIRLAYEVQNR